MRSREQTVEPPPITQWGAPHRTHQWATKSQWAEQALILRKGQDLRASSARSLRTARACGLGPLRVSSSGYAPPSGGGGAGCTPCSPQPHGCFCCERRGEEREKQIPWSAPIPAHTGPLSL